MFDPFGVLKYWGVLFACARGDGGSNTLNSPCFPCSDIWPLLDTKILAMHRKYTPNTSQNFFLRCSSSPGYLFPSCTAKTLPYNFSHTALLTEDPNKVGHFFGVYRLSRRTETYPDGMHLAMEHIAKCLVTGHTDLRQIMPRISAAYKTWIFRNILTTVPFGEPTIPSPANIIPT